MNNWTKRYCVIDCDGNVWGHDMDYAHAVVCLDNAILSGAEEPEIIKQ